jgi:hypothetical protein
MKLLESKIQALSENPYEPEPVPSLPAIARQVAGQTYIMAPNPAELQSVSLSFEEGAEALIIMGTSPGETSGVSTDPQG